MQDGISKEGRALGDAITQGRFDDFLRHLDAGLDPNGSVAAGYEALAYAAMMGQLEMCAKLIERGADVNLQRVFGTGEQYDCGPAPVHRAAQYGHVEVVRLLLSRGADANVVTFRGARPLHYAVGNNSNYAQWVSLAQVLLEHGADANAIMDRWTDGRHWTNQHGYAKTHGGLLLFITPMHAAIETSAMFQSAQGARHGFEVRGHQCGGAQVIRLLLEHGADPHLSPEGATNIYLTPFQQALKQAPSEDIELILGHSEVDLGQRTLAGKTLAQLTLGRPAARSLVMSAKTTRLLERDDDRLPREDQPTRSRDLPEML